MCTKQGIMWLGHPWSHNQHVNKEFESSLCSRLMDPYLSGLVLYQCCHRQAVKFSFFGLAWCWLCLGSRENKKNEMPMHNK